MNDSNQIFLRSLYKQYNEVIKPLIALYEAREEKFPTPLFNEIRAFNDHIARCHLNNATQDFVDDQLRKAGRHISRMILDCYKYLNISFNAEIVKFERKTKNVDLSIIDNGKFYLNYRELRANSIRLIRNAKKIESQASDDEIIFKSFEEAFNAYSELDELISVNFTNINWAKAKSWIKKYSWVIAAIFSAIVSLILSLTFTCDFILNWFR